MQLVYVSRLFVSSLHPLKSNVYYMHMGHSVFLFCHLSITNCNGHGAFSSPELMQVSMCDGITISFIHAR